MTLVKSSTIMTVCAIIAILPDIVATSDRSDLVMVK